MEREARVMRPSFSFYVRLKSQAHAVESEAVSRRPPAEKIYPASFSNAAEAPAAQASIRIIHQVRAPFPDVTRHVIYPQLIRQFLSNRMSRSAAILLIPANFVQIIAAAIDIFRGLFASSGGDDPFGFSW